MALADYLNAGRLVVVGAAAALVVIIGLVVVKTAPGAAVIASARCASHWLKLDRGSYQACFDVEREQILEDRARRHIRFDE